MPEQEKEFTLNVDIAVSGKDPEDASIKLVRKFHKGGIEKWWIGDVTEKAADDVRHVPENKAE